VPHRNNLLELISVYRRRFPLEFEQVTRLEEFVRQNPDCFARELLIGHITGSAWVIDKTATRTLLTHHRKLDKWLQPGGHSDGMSDVAEVAMKEAEEESGLAGLRLVSAEIFDIDIHRIPERKNEPEHFHYDCRFLIQCGSNDRYRVSHESNDLAWVNLPELPNYTTEASVVRMSEKCADFLATDR